MWISRRAYEKLMTRNDDRDFAAARAEIERVRSDVRALRTWLQRNIDALVAPEDEPEAPKTDASISQYAVPGGWK